MQRAALLSVLVALAVTLIAPEYWGVFFFSAVAAFFLFSAFRMRDGGIAVLLFLPVPLLSYAFGLPFWLRLSCAVLYGLLFTWAVTDIRLRRKGAAVHVGRSELFIYAGLWGINAALFAGLDTFPLPQVFLLLISGLASFLGAALIGDIAERSRATLRAGSFLFVDAYFTAILSAEAFVALSFLPLSPLTLSAVLMTLLWAVMALLIAVRTDRFRTRYLFRIVVIAAGLLLALFSAVPFQSLP